MPKLTNGANELQLGDELSVVFSFKSDGDMMPTKAILTIEIVTRKVKERNAAAEQVLQDSITSKSEIQAVPADSMVVQCRKFAWSPNPQRIELVNEEDLKRDIVRRRAVFQWVDSVAVSATDTFSKYDWSYAIQKITPSGSTHFPWLELSRSS